MGNAIEGLREAECSLSSFLSISDAKVLRNTRECVDILRILVLVWGGAIK
jgi:hypothetical protein